MLFIIAVALGAIIVAAMFLAANRGIKIAWYEWLIGIVGLFLLLFTIQNYFGSLSEFEPEAAQAVLLVTGIPSILLLAVAISLGWRRNRSKA